MDFDLEESVLDALYHANEVRTSYAENAEQAAQLCKPVRSKSKKAWWPTLQCRDTYIDIYTYQCLQLYIYICIYV